MLSPVQLVRPQMVRSAYVPPEIGADNDEYVEGLLEKEEEDPVAALEAAKEEERRLHGLKKFRWDKHEDKAVLEGYIR